MNHKFKTRRGRKIYNRAMNKTWGLTYSRRGSNYTELSRKEKKYYIGTKVSKNKLKKRLSEMIIHVNEFGEIMDYSDHFCPECGCEITRSSGNTVSYPEVWERVYCIRCGFLMGEADNSPMYTFFELDDGDYWREMVKVRKDSDTTDKEEFEKLFK